MVYNHTAEGNHVGPTLSMRGLDNPAYYRLVADDPRYYMDYTGTGNTLNMRHPHVLQLVMDSLRYWIEEMHVDGFRFDLASALARGLHEVDRLGAFFDLIQQDPVVSRVKLIAEPWDVGEGGYQVGNFPPLWSEWNGKYRDWIRDYWRGEPGSLPELGCAVHRQLATSTSRAAGSRTRASTSSPRTTASRCATSSRTTRSTTRRTARTTATARATTARGTAAPRAPTDDPRGATRCARRQQRNFLATLFLSQGVPMLLGGDELGRTQRGNNNAYCQDNEISWFDWEHADQRAARVHARARGAAPRPPGVPPARLVPGPADPPRQAAPALPDIAWFTPDGDEMTDEHWDDAAVAHRCRCSSTATASRVPDERGEPIVDDTFLIVFHAAPRGPARSSCPSAAWGEAWRRVLDTERGFATAATASARRRREIAGARRARSWVLRRVT